MQVWASVNEADIGRIKTGMDTTFTVATLPKEVFKGKVKQIRLNAQSTQNVVTYTVVIDVDNHDLNLLPYLTADVKFEIGERHNVLCVPNARLRRKPRLGQLPLTTGPAPVDNARRDLIWVKVGDGRHVRPVKVRTGITDATMTEVSGPEVKEGMEAVVGQGQESLTLLRHQFAPSPWDIERRTPCFRRERAPSLIWPVL